MTITSKAYGVDMTQRIEAYHAATQPAYEAYQAATQPAREAYEAASMRAWEAYQAVGQPARAAYRAVEQPAREAYESSKQHAWEALACGDPLVDWIIANCATYKIEALTILRALPADLDTLDDIAMAEDWCAKWENRRDEAIHAGVISR